MTFTQQVQHVVRFDLRRTAILWMLYLALLAITPLAMFGQPLYQSLPALSRMFLPLLTWSVGMGMAVIVVQADSPLSPTAFWKGKPLEERALGTAKLVVLGLIILAATITAVMVWRAMDMPPRLIVPTLRQAVPAYLIPVLFTAIFGAVTRSLARALLLSVVFLMFMFLLVPAVFLSTGMPNAAIGLTTSAWTNASGSVLLCSSLALVFLYSWRRVNHVRPIWLVATALLLGTAATVSQFFAVISGTITTSIAYADRTMVLVTADAPSSMPESVRFDSIPIGQWVGGRVPFTITGARQDRRYELQQLRLTPFDGRGIGGPAITLLTTPLAVPAEALEMPATAGWSTDEPTATSLTPDRGLIYGDWRVSETLDSVRSISLEGVVVRYRAERVNVVPFALGQVYADSTISIQLTEGRNGLLELAWTSFYNEPDRSGLASGTSPLYREFAFAVIDSGQEFVRLLGSSSHFGSTEWMVLPGAFRWVNSNQLDYQPALRALMGSKGQPTASLAVYKWVEDGRRRVRQIIGVNDWPRREPRRRTPRALVTTVP